VELVSDSAHRLPALQICHLMSYLSTVCLYCNLTVKYSVADDLTGMKAFILLAAVNVFQSDITFHA
jgi:hypothetical protein